MQLTFSIRCTFCANRNDNDFYFMPLTQKVLDGEVLLHTHYSIVCKKCGQKQLLRLLIDRCDGKSKAVNSIK